MYVFIEIYSINFIEQFCWNLHYNKANKYEKEWLNVYVYDFSVDLDAIAVDSILHIHKYLMKKKNDINV